MQWKKRDDNLIPILVAIFALIALAVWYQFLGDYTIQKVDAALGIKTDFEITDLIIEKGYNSDSGLKVPEILINYKTTREVASYISIEGKDSEMTIGKEFSKKILLSRDYFGKTVSLKIVAKDETGNRVEIDRAISLPQNIEPTIAVITT